MPYKLGTLTISTEKSAPAADTIPLSAAELLFWQDAPYMDFALPTYAPYSGSPFKTKAFINGSEVDVSAANTFVTRSIPASGSPFAGRNLFSFANNANAVIPCPTLALGESYTIIVPFTCSALFTGGLMAHILTTGDFMGFSVNVNGQLVLRHGALSTGRYFGTGNNAYAANFMNVAIATFNKATMVGRLYGMVGSSMKIAPLQTYTFTYAAMNSVGYNVGNVHGQAGAYQMDDIIAFNSAIDVTNPTLFARIQANIAAKYGLSTVA